MAKEMDSYHVYPQHRSFNRRFDLLAMYICEGHSYSSSSSRRPVKG